MKIIDKFEYRLYYAKYFAVTRSKSASPLSNPILEEMPTSPSKTLN